MTDPEDFRGGRPAEVVCRGSYALGTACGRCSRCRAEMDRLQHKPTFKVTSEKLGADVIANFRVRPEVHAKIKTMAEANGVGVADVVRQMIDFAMENA